MKLKFKKPKFDLSIKGIKNFLKTMVSNTTLQVVTLVAVLIVVNIGSLKYFVRFDITESKIYSLSEGTTTILSNLEEPVDIELYISDNMPPAYMSHSQDVGDVFNEYKRFGGNNVNLIVKNPQDESFGTEAISRGIPEVPFGERTQDKVEIAQGFLGVAITYKEKTETIEFIRDIANLEYDVTSRIFKLTNENKTRIGYLTGHGEKNGSTNYSIINNMLENQFEVTQVDLSEGTPIKPEEISVLIIAAPTEDLSERDRFEIDQYLMNNGNVLVLADKYNTDLQLLSLNKNESNFYEFLENYGVKVKQQVILDESFTPVRNGFVPIAYPYWVLAQEENIDHSIPAFAQIQSSTFFWVNPIESKDLGDNRSFQKLIKSSEVAWVESGDTISIDIRNFTRPGSQDQFVVAGIVEGNQSSVYKDQEIPSLEAEEGMDIVDTRTDADERKMESEGSRIVVIGDSEFISDEFIQGNEQNSVFFMNLVEWLSNSDDLAKIRSKNIVTRPLTVLSRSQKNYIKVILFSFVPFVAVGAGITYNTLRTKKRSLI